MVDLDDFLSGIASRDADAFSAWMAGAEPALRRSLRRFAVRVDVESVVQETLLRIWQVAPRHTPDGRADSLLRLALRIARNLALDEARRASRMIPVDDEHVRDSRGPAADAAFPDAILRRVVMGCLRALPATQRRVMSARLRAAGERDEALAAGLEMAVNTFRQNVARARRALRACLERHGVDVAEHIG